MIFAHFTSLVSLTCWWAQKRLVLCFLSETVCSGCFFFWKISSTLAFLSLCLCAFPNIFPFQPHLSSSLLSAMVLFPSLCHCLKVNYQVSNVAHEKWPVKQLREQIIYPYLMHLDSLIHSGGICLTCVRIFSASSHFLSNNSLLKPSGLLLVVFICLY